MLEGAFCFQSPPPDFNRLRRTVLETLLFGKRAGARNVLPVWARPGVWARCSKVLEGARNILLSSESEGRRGRSTVFFFRFPAEMIPTAMPAEIRRNRFQTGSRRISRRITFAFFRKQGLRLLRAVRPAWGDHGGLFADSLCAEH